MGDPLQPNGAPAIVVSEGGALVPLLGLGLIITLSVLGFIESHPPYTPNEGGMAATPHSPSEFPEVFANNPALDGLAGMDGGIVFAPTPPLGGDFPCMDCHGDQEPNPKRRKLEDAHEKIVLAHGGESRWCLDCHDLKNRDMLHLASGELVPFEESHRLCGQCHGAKQRDWEAGIHGKRTGYWNGPKRVLQCVSCHRPHSPHFAQLKPLPPPVRPQYLRPETRPSAEELAAKAAEAARANPEEATNKESGHGH